MVQSVVGDAGAVQVLNDNPPMLLGEDAPIHQTLCEIIGQRESHGVSYASDAGWPMISHRVWWIGASSPSSIGGLSLSTCTSPASPTTDCTM